MDVLLVAVDFINRDDKKSEQREKQNTCQIAKKYGTYKSTISQNNNHQAKFKLTQEKMTVLNINR